jgi:hypothetical protein
VSNLAPACFRCNMLKGKRTLDEFLRDRPAFSEHVLNSTPIGKPIQQAAALAAVGKTVEKPKPMVRQRHLQDVMNYEKQILREILDKEQNISWAWKNPA